MKITYDKNADAAYMYLREIKDGEVDKTVQLSDSIIIDIDEQGKTIGIEVLDASKELPDELLKQAVDISRD